MNYIDYVHFCNTFSIFKNKNRSTVKETQEKELLKLFLKNMFNNSDLFKLRFKSSFFIFFKILIKKALKADFEIIKMNHLSQFFEFWKNSFLQSMLKYLTLLSGSRTESLYFKAK